MIPLDKLCGVIDFCHNAVLVLFPHMLCALLLSSDNIQSFLHAVDVLLDAYILVALLLPSSDGNIRLYRGQCLHSTLNNSFLAPRELENRMMNSKAY